MAWIEYILFHHTPFYKYQLNPKAASTDCPHHTHCQIKTARPRQDYGWVQQDSRIQVTTQCCKTNLQAWTNTMSCLSCDTYERDNFTWPFPDPQGSIPSLIISTILESRIYWKQTHNRNMCNYFITCCVRLKRMCQCVCVGRFSMFLTLSSALSRILLSGEAPSRWNHWSRTSCGSASSSLTGTTRDPIGWSQPLDNYNSKEQGIEKNHSIRMWDADPSNAWKYLAFTRSMWCLGSWTRK